MGTLEITTTRGLARVSLREADEPRGLLLLGPGASGYTDATDLALAVSTALEAGLTAGIVTPPYAVEGKKVPPRGSASDEAWAEIVAAVRAEVGDLPTITGGRSYGSRVACRTSAATGSVGVLCLAFPLHPPGKPEQTRLSDLESATVPTLVIQGRSDPFGLPPEADHRRVVQVEGDHGLKKQHDVIARTIAEWIDEVLGATR